jgi:hypothetical protein
VSDDSYIAKVITTILSLRHTSLLGSNPILSSYSLFAECGRKSAVIRISLIRLIPWSILII